MWNTLKWDLFSFWTDRCLLLLHLFYFFLIIVFKCRRDPIGIKNLNAHRLKLGLASRNLWLSSPHVAECHRFFLLSARSLFQQVTIFLMCHKTLYLVYSFQVSNFVCLFIQMMLAHEKSFEAETFLLIKSLLFSAQVIVIMVTSFFSWNLVHVFVIWCRIYLLFFYNSKPMWVILHLF